jgi:4-hydroxy-3-methylbut-2-enyl diphosphate reductase
MTSPPSSDSDDALHAFHSPLVGDLLAADPPGLWSLSGGQIRLPRVFGFCRGVKRALAMALDAIDEHAEHSGRLVLLGEIIHNPFVNDTFRAKGVTILTRQQRQDVEQYITSEDCAIIPAFGVPLPIQKRLEKIGCHVVDCSCGDVIRLWRWSEQAVADGFGVMIYGRANHDETIVTKSRLEAVGGYYLVVESLEVAQQLATDPTDQTFRRLFNADHTNAASLDPFGHLAQVSQTTMLFNETLEIRDLIRLVFEKRFGPEEAQQRLRFQPTVCRATQDRQNAAVELCEAGCDLLLVVGGFGSSNTQHLHHLARRYAPSYLIEDASAIHSDQELEAWDVDAAAPRLMRGWWPAARPHHSPNPNGTMEDEGTGPLSIGVLAGASSPEVVIGEVLRRLAEFLR